MEFSPPTVSNGQNGRAAPRPSARLLARLIEVSFASHASSYTFRDAFRDFARAYFTLSLDDQIQFWHLPEEQPIKALAQAFDDAVTSGRLAPLVGPSRLVARSTLTSLSALEKHVMDGTLTPSEAVDLVTTMVFEGIQASRRSCS